MDRTKDRPRPHKVCLLLAVLDLIRAGTLKENRILFNEPLRQAFTKRFERLKQDNDRDNPEFRTFICAHPAFGTTSLSPERKKSTNGG